MNPPRPPISPAPDNHPAYALWIELATSVTSQRLHYRAGDEETAARNVFRLFGRTRELLAEHPEAIEFRTVALRLLNTILRPYTSRWHGWMRESRAANGSGGEKPLEFRDEQVRRMFRTELAELQQLLREARVGLAKLAGIEEPAERGDGAGANLGPDIIVGIGNQVVINDGGEGVSVIERVNEAERAEIRRRRSCYRPGPGPIVNATGLALSGGGIRSATFCLGIIQVLVRRNLFRDIDYLSTVSGGGYVGSFLSCALGSTTTADTEDEVRRRIDDVFHREKSGVESGLLRHLRNNSKYLLNGGIRARLQIVGLLVSGILCNMLLVLPIPLFGAASLYLVDKAGVWGTAMVPGHSIWAPISTLAGGVLAAAALAAGAFVLFLPAVQKLGHGQPPQSRRAIFRRSFGWMAILAGVMLIAAGLFYVFPAIFELYERLRLATAGGNASRWFQFKDWTALGAAGGGSVLLGVLASTLKSSWPRLKRMAARLFILSGPVFFALILLLVGNRLGLRHTIDTANSATPWPVAAVLLTALGLALWGWFLVNINTLSPHTYYRGKLCECYLARRRGALSDDAKRQPRLHAWKRKILTGESEQGRTEALQQVRLSELRASQAAPYHLINSTLNVPASANKELRGRNGDFFVVSKHYCGAPLVGYEPTASIEASDPHFDLGTAMAVSGAAASTNMGWQTLPHFRFLMTLFNVRLGYWLRWPRSGAIGGPGAWYFFREMFGAIDEGTAFLNLSDGGHIENLAVYELLRRRVKFIVCVDAGMEPGMQCADLTRLQRYAEIDLGIRFEYSTADLHLQPNGFSRSFAILVKIIYPPSAASALPELGWMIYTKLAVTGTEPAYVLDYRRENPAFPHQTTGDQFFDEAQFEAYRRLGECAAESLFRDELTAGQPVATLRDWFQLLANNLLADNDPVFRTPPAAVSAARGTEGRN